jgi:hypothetical protein
MGGAEDVSAQSDKWLGPLALVFLAITTGYGIKARALRIASWIGAPTLWLFGSFRKYKLAELKFPYNAILRDTEAYKAISSFVVNATTFELDGLPANQPFSSVKRLLLLKAPALWEECEHREAEVRLVGTLCSAAMFSTVLAITEIVRESLWYVLRPNAVVWFAASLALMVFLADAFNHIRIREVEYAYLNAIIAFNGDARGMFVSAGKHDAGKRAGE